MAGDGDGTNVVCVGILTVQFLKLCHMHKIGIRLHKITIEQFNISGKGIHIKDTDLYKVDEELIKDTAATLFFHQKLIK